MSIQCKKRMEYNVLWQKTRGNTFIWGRKGKKLYRRKYNKAKFLKLEFLQKKFLKCLF